MEYLLHVLILICIYGIAIVGLSVAVGYAGMVPITQAAFFGVGAYATALLSLRLGAPFWVCVPVSILSALTTGAIVGLGSVRLRDDLFVLATFGFQIIVFELLNNVVALTNGPMGLAGIPPAALFGIDLQSQASYLMTSVLALALAIVTARRLTASPFGTVLRAMQNDDVLAQSLGRRTSVRRIQALSISAGFAGLGGALYAYHISFVDPTTFTVSESVLLLTAVIIGGAGSSAGALLGTVILVGLPEMLRMTPLPASTAADLRQLLYGALLVIFMLRRPRGIVEARGEWRV